jgi:hypothetical protein
MSAVPQVRARFLGANLGDSDANRNALQSNLIVLCPHLL